MRNVWLVARREYRERIRTRGFLITTIMIPVIMGGFIFGSIFLGSKTPGDQHIAIVSSDTQLALDLQTEMQIQQQKKKEDDQSNSEDVPSSTASHKKSPSIVVEAIDPGPNTRAELDQDLDSNQIDGYLWITPAASAGERPKFEFIPKSSSEDSLRNILSMALSKVLLREQLNHRGIVATDTEALLQPVTITTIRSAHHDDRTSAEISVSVLFFIMYLVIMLYGMNVARSIIEEKTSRIFEILLATIRPEAMMAGKILGVGAVGLTQVGIWLAGALLIAGSSVAIHLGTDTVHVELTLGQVLYFLLYFILGYLFYSAIAAALGAMTNSEQELQQLNMFLMLPLLVCFVLLGTLLSNPDSPLARMAALFPPFTPLIMYMRVSLGHPRPWEIVLSILLTFFSICVIIWITSRIYRVGILMYGKRPNLPEILRWLKYT